MKWQQEKLQAENPLQRNVLQEQENLNLEKLVEEKPRVRELGGSFMEDSNSKYHKWLNKILEQFSKENKDKLIKIRGSLKLTTGRVRCKSVLEYNPDFCFNFKSGKRSFEYIVFEFLDKQSQEGIIADIVECACIKNCRVLLFLSKSAEKHKQSEKVIDIVGDFLNEINGNDLLDIVNLHIPQDMDEEEVKDIIYKEIDKKVTLPKQKFILGKSSLGGRAVLG